MPTRTQPPLEHRVVFDFEVDFSNGGGIQGQGFRLDIDGDDISDDALAAYIVRDMRLLMVGEVRIVAKSIIVEAHKRGRQRRGSSVGSPRRPQPQRGRRHDHLPGPAGSGHHGSPDPRRLAIPLRRRDDVLHRVDPDGRQHRDLPGLAVPSVRGRRRPGRPAARARRGPRRGRRPPRPVGRSGDRAGGLRRRRRSTVGRSSSRPAGTATGGPTPTARATRSSPRPPPAPWSMVARRLVGIDSLNIDDTADGRRPAHTALLAAGIPIVEHLTGLAALPADRLPVLRRPREGRTVRDVPGALLRDPRLDRIRTAAGRRTPGPAPRPSRRA